ncbi:MAG: hypothetical protein IJQ47_03070 [Synergistaceae bacterium]|nr:hypothetical protein [Synergistaceae bacterium]
MIPKLRGNTFLTLLLRSGVQELGEAPKWGENNGGITRANMFADLLRMAQPVYSPRNLKTLQSYFSQYLSGERPFSDAYFDFEKSGFRHGLENRINSDYQTVLAEMDRFYCKYLRKSDIDRQQLVGGIVDTILQDQTFSGKFNVGDIIVDKKDLNSVKSFTLQPFLVSVWNEILMSHPDTSEGKDTYMSWTKEAGYNSPRSIVTQIGVERAKEITVSDKISGGNIMKSIPEQPDQPDQTGTEATAENNEQKKASEQAKNATTQQTVSHNGHVYNQNAEKIFNIEHIENFKA